MTLKEIPYSEFRPAIKAGFEGDKNIFSFYDKNVSVKTIEDVVDDVYKKIYDYTVLPEQIFIKGVFENKELIGYVVRKYDLLISFSISVRFRTKEYLLEFFNLIKKEFNKIFYCYLWSVNIRAVKWLKRMGMEITEFNHEIIKLRLCI